MKKDISNSLINEWAKLAEKEFRKTRKLNEEYESIENVLQQALGVLLEYAANDRSNSEMRNDAIRILTELRVRKYIEVHPNDEKLWNKLNLDDEEF